MTQISHENELQLRKLTPEDRQKYTKVIRNLYPESLLKKLFKSKPSTASQTRPSNSPNPAQNKQAPVDSTSDGNPADFELNYASLKDIVRLQSDFVVLAFARLFDVRHLRFEYVFGAPHLAFDQNKDYISNLVHMMQSDSQHELVSLDRLRQMLQAPNAHLKQAALRSLIGLTEHLRSTGPDDERTCIEFYLVKSKSQLQLTSHPELSRNVQVLGPWDACLSIHAKSNPREIGETRETSQESTQSGQVLSRIGRVFAKCLSPGHAIHFKKPKAELILQVISELNVFAALSRVLQRRPISRELLLNVVRLAELLVSFLYKRHFTARQRISEFFSLEADLFGSKADIDEGRVRFLGAFDIRLLINICKSAKGTDLVVGTKLSQK